MMLRKMPNSYKNKSPNCWLHDDVVWQKILQSLKSVDFGELLGQKNSSNNKMIFVEEKSVKLHDDVIWLKIILPWTSKLLKESA